MRLQNNGMLAQSCALNELYGLGHNYLFTFEKRIRETTPEQIKEAARSVFKPEQLAVSVVLPAREDPGEEKIVRSNLILDPHPFDGNTPTPIFINSEPSSDELE